MLRRFWTVLGLMAAVGSARADKWSHPAAGESASGDPELLLTFDDGPSERYTPTILDTLKRHRLHAVFFWVGHRVSRPISGLEDRRAVVRRAIAEGQIVGNHTMSHSHLCVGPAAEAAHEIDSSAQILGTYAGMPTSWFRAPYGSKCRRLIAMLEERNLRHLHWDIDPHEWESHDAPAAAASVIRRLRRLQGRAVLLMHDTQLVTAQALPMILDWVAAENERRVASGRRPIRIISFADVARERLAPGLADWLGGCEAAARGAGERLGRLVPAGQGAKLSGRIPPARF